MQGCGGGVPGVWILAQGRSRSFIFFIPESESCQKDDCFFIFMYLLQCHIISLCNWTGHVLVNSNLHFVCVLCTVLEHAMIDMRFQ